MYKYKVLQWGDEKKLLTNEEILNTFYFKWYENPSLNLWEVKNYLNSYYNDAKYIKTDSSVNLSEHTYLSPGIKSIKTIVFRTNQFQTHVFETKLITTNILINDGLITSQDFSILGGVDFKFLPFIKEDYLERASSRDFINNFNNKLYGEPSGQLDLSLTRVFNKPFDIYDFIKGDRALIAENEFNLNDINLPVNSQATDIFINNNNCIIDINPNEIEFSTIQNKVGVGDKAILIGDYKINQPKDGRVQKEGTMKTPLIENDIDKQAF